MGTLAVYDHRGPRFQALLGLWQDIAGRVTPEMASMVHIYFVELKWDIVYGLSVGFVCSRWTRTRGLWL